MFLKTKESKYLGKSGAVNSVLSSLQFKGDPNQSSASITLLLVMEMISLLIL